MCACTETDMRESPNYSALAGGEGHGSRGEMCQPIYRESPVSSVVEHPLYVCMQDYRQYVCIYVCVVISGSAANV
jgi:hypothetical protein